MGKVMSAKPSKFDIARRTRSPIDPRGATGPGYKKEKLVRVACRQVAGRHVKDPLTIAKAESRRRETQRAA